MYDWITGFLSILTDFAQIGVLSAYVSYVRDVLTNFFRAPPHLFFIPHAVPSNQTFGIKFSLSCLSYLPSISLFYVYVVQLSMVSALWKACSEGDLTNVHEFLKDASVVDIEIKGTNRFTWLCV